MSPINVQCIHVGEYDMNCYLVENTDTQELFIVDPGAEGEKIIRAIGSRKPVAVLCTHGHYDHIGGVDQVCMHYGIPLYLHGADIPKLTSEKWNGSRRFERDMTVRTEATPIGEGDVLPLAGIDVTVWNTPGHSKGSCCFLLPEGQGVFCGDTLFAGGYGRTDFEDGDFKEIKQSLRRLIFMNPRQIAYPGHGETIFAGRNQPEESL